ncbi:MAG: hypothetical protein M3X11_01725 [Acidobacteriota bacterium]|nr:hypothetical protein [Acidobacteriota bacterium]
MKRYKPSANWLSPCLLCLGLVGLLGWAMAISGPETVSAQAPAVTIVNSASYATDAFAPESMASAFGSFVTTNNQTFVAPSAQLPPILGGVRVTVNGIDSGMIVASPGQLNFVLPQTLSDGPNSVVITNSDNSTRQTTINIQRAAPGIFTARSSGYGAAAAVTTSDGVNYQSTFNPDGSEREISAGTKDRPNYLVLFSTGVHFAAAINPNDSNGVAEAVTATIQGVPAQVSFAGRAGNFPGLDQLNIIIPPELAGIGLARVRLNIAGRGSNVAMVLIGGQPPTIRANAIAVGAGLFGALTPDDQVQAAIDGSGRTYFYDAYRFRTTTANTAVSVDVRSSQFDAAVSIVQQRTDGTIVPLAADDQTGGLGSGQDDNNNALLLTVLRDPGDYLILVTSADSDPNATGGYQLGFATGGIQQLSYSPTPVNGSISNTDLITSAGDYLDAYWFVGTAGDVVQIRMNSTAFDSFLILNSDSGDLLAFDDNSGGGAQGRDSLLTFRLQASGNFILLATPFEPRRTGGYTLTLNRLNSSLTAGEDETQAAIPGRTLISERSPRRTQFDRLTSRRIVHE